MPSQAIQDMRQLLSFWCTNRVTLQTSTAIQFTVNAGDVMVTAFTVVRHHMPARLTCGKTSGA